MAGRYFARWNLLYSGGCERVVIDHAANVNKSHSGSDHLLGRKQSPRPDDCLPRTMIDQGNCVIFSDRTARNGLLCPAIVHGNDRHICTVATKNVDSRRKKRRGPDDENIAAVYLERALEQQ